MFGEVDHTQLNVGLIYALAECPQCAKRFAVALDPFIPDQCLFYDRDQTPTVLSHICSGGLLCLRGHALVVTRPQVVLTQAAEWLDVAVPAAPPALN